MTDLRRLAFGDDDANNRTKAAIVEPWTALPDVEAVADELEARTGIRGYRLSARPRGHNRGMSGHNRGAETP